MDVDESEVVRVLAIDPGSSTTGIVVMDVYPELGVAEIIHRRTIDTRFRLQQEKLRAERLGDFSVKLEKIYDEVLDVCRIYRPDRTRHETPYMGKLPLPAIRLTQVCTAIRRALWDYNPSMPVEGIDPSTVKKHVGVPGNSGDKELMRCAVVGIANIKNSTGTVLSAFTEHEIDAGAIGYYDAVTELGIPRRLKS